MYLKCQVKYLFILIFRYAYNWMIIMSCPAHYPLHLQNTTLQLHSKCIRVAWHFVQFNIFSLLPKSKAFFQKMGFDQFIFISN
jgi:hypothetical protein